MTIKDFSQLDVESIVAQHLTPSDFISDPGRLIGRERYMEQVRRALLSPGRHVFISGERGVGKTSVAITAARSNVVDNENFIYIPCAKQTTFFEVIQSIGNSVIDVGSRLGSDGWGFGGGGSLVGLGSINASYKSGGVKALNAPRSWSDVYDILQFVRSKRNGQIVVVVDEFDRVSSREKTEFAELLKNVGAKVTDMRFIFCGIGANVNEILGGHLSTGRMFEPVEIEKLPHDALWKIISDASEPLNIEIDQGILTRIGIVSDGFPHYVHLIGQCLIYAMLDDHSEVTKCERRHFDLALKEALQKTEPSLKLIYSMATEKSRKQSEYEEALWALADRTETRRKLDDILKSYIRVFEQRYAGIEGVKPISRNTLNHRLLALRKDSHANVLLGHGSGFFSFREGVVRGYVRLMAENSGVELNPELIA